ncbi:DLH domain-containing protein [Citrus sinensis]|nr:DLH domain-containing protein [Citrus sinensis]
MSGPQCCANPPTLNPNSGAGHVEKLGGLNTYVTGSPDSKVAALLISDVFGYEAPNLRKLADKVAAAGFYVAVPDFFHGDPNVDGGRPLQEWIKDHGVDKGFEEAKPVIQALKCRGITATGAVGFCWGAKVAVQLAKREFIQAAVLLHPSFVTVDDIKGVEVPISVLGAEIDQFSPPALVKEFEEALTAKSEHEIAFCLTSMYGRHQISLLQVDSFVKIFPKVAHGWSVRYNAEDEFAVKAAEEAHQNLLEWLTKYVK